MSRLSFRPSVGPLAVAVGALALAACSDSPVSPTRSLASSSANFNVTGTNPLTIVSGATTQLCSAQQVNGDYTIPAGPGYGPFAGCGVALDLTASLNVYNPGWSMPFTGSSWIGFNAKAGPSSDYRANPGRSVYQETFTIPASVTNPVLDINVKADNVAAVYLNGKLLGSQANTDCNPGLNCNWNPLAVLHIVDNTAADFHIGASNTLTFLVIDLPTGAFSAVAGVGGPAPQYGCTRSPQPTGNAGYSATTVNTSPDHIIAGGGTGVAITNLGAANQAGCENPTGLDFAATMSWTVPQPPRVVALFVIGDVEAHAIGDNVNFWGAQWWKNNDMSGVVGNGVASFKGYATISDNVCGGTWQSLPGNSSNPPDVIPTDVAIIVTSTVLKNGNNISGDIKQIVIVHSDGGYGPNPGHRGNGPVTSIVCTAP